MIIYIVHVLVLRILVGHATQMLFAEIQVVQLVFEYYPCMVQTIHDDEVTFTNLVFRKRNLCEIIFPSVRVVLCAVAHILQRVFYCFGSHDRVALFVGHLANIIEAAYHSLVAALPVVNILALSP